MGRGVLGTGGPTRSVTPGCQGPPGAKDPRVSRSPTVPRTPPRVPRIPTWSPALCLTLCHAKALRIYCIAPVGLLVGSRVSCGPLGVLGTRLGLVGGSVLWGPRGGGVQVETHEVGGLLITFPCVVGRKGSRHMETATRTCILTLFMGQRQTV